MNAPALHALGQSQAAADLWMQRHPYAMSHGGQGVPSWVLAGDPNYYYGHLTRYQGTTASGLAADCGYRDLGGGLNLQ